MPLETIKDMDRGSSSDSDYLVNRKIQIKI